MGVMCPHSQIKKRRRKTPGRVAMLVSLRVLEKEVDHWVRDPGKTQQITVRGAVNAHMTEGENACKKELLARA